MIDLRAKLRIDGAGGLAEAQWLGRAFRWEKAAVLERTGFFRTAVVLTALASAGLAHAQGTGTYSRVGREINSLDRTLMDGRLLGVPSGNNAPVGTQRGAAQGGYADPQRAAYTGGSPRRASSGMGGGSRVGGMRTSIMAPFGATATAMAYAPPTFTGYSRPTPPLWPGFGESTMKLVWADETMYAQMAYNHRAWGKVTGGAVRDELTNASLAASENEQLPDLSLLMPQQSTSARMAAEASAWQHRQAEDAWADLRGAEKKQEEDADYRAARCKFENALIFDQDNVECRVGLLIAAAMDEQFDTAVAQLKLLLDKDADLLSVQRPFAVTLKNANRGQMILMRLTRMPVGYTGPDGYAALRAYLLWVDGRTGEARELARKIARESPTSDFAVLATRMDARATASEGGENDELPPLRALSGSALR